MAGPAERQQTETAQVPPWMTRFNPPGLSQLVYRGGRYGRAVGDMLKDLPAAPPLARLNTAAKHDWTLALVRAWAAATEVLGFYQERIVNEGYLRTATERRSVLELARTIGYELRPGVAASADLAFTVLTTRDEPSRQVVIPAGTAVQSVPAPGEQAQTFETSAELVARSEWNTLKPALIEADSWPQCPLRETTSARLIGVELGLRPSETILIIGDPPVPGAPERPWLLATLETVQPFPELGYTLVTWQDPQIPAGSESLDKPQAFVLRQRAELFGYTPGGVYCTRNPGSARSPRTGGVAMGKELKADSLSEGDSPENRPAESWAPAAVGLPKAPVHVLIGDAQGVLFTGTGLGLFRSVDQGENWQPVSVGLVRKEIHALTFDPDGHLLAGTGDGYIYLSKDGGDKWITLTGEEVVLPPRGLAKLWSRGRTPLPKLAIRSLKAYSRGHRYTLVAATDDGVFRSRDRGKTWQPANQDLPKTDAKTGLASVVAWALATTGSPKKEELYAGTDAGVFHIREALNFRLLIVAMLALVLLGLLYPHDLQTRLGMAAFFLVVALIADMVVIGARFLDRILSRLAPISLGRPVRTLVAGPNGVLFAGTEQGLWRSDDGSAKGLLQQVKRYLARLLLGDLARRWRLVSTSWTNQDVRALQVDDADGHLIAATDDGSVFRSRDDGKTWEPFGTGLPLKRIRAMFATQDKVFAAGVPSESLVESRWSPFQVAQKVIDLDQEYPDILPNSWLVLRGGQGTPVIPYQVTEVEVVDSRDPARPGRFSRLTVDRSAGLEGFDRTSTLSLIQSEPVGLLPNRPLNRDTLTFDRYVPGLAAGQKLIVSGKRLRASLSKESEDSDEIVSEVVEITKVLCEQKRTEVSLKSPLTNRYDGPTVIVYGNVVQATHGRTVEPDLLGSGEGLAAHQRFLLKQPPLTYAAAANAVGVESTLKIEIDGVRWKQVASFDELDRDKRAFMLRQDDQDNTAVLFGFGPEDTGIPRGAEQIIATYRQGVGSAGNVAAGSLHVLQTAVPGLKGVTNPLAASGGADPEMEAEAQAKAPLSVRTVERIVSLGDYEDFARQFAGIGKAQAKLISKDYRRWLYITIADTAGNEVAQDSALYKNLADAIRRARAGPVPEVVIESFERVSFCLKATVWVERDHQARKAEIIQDAETALKAEFAFERREFGQSVAAAEIIKLIQRIRGVFAVQLKQLYKHNRKAELCLLLNAEGARWDAGHLYPAQMLVIDPEYIELD